MTAWLNRQKEGSVLCPSCGNLVGVNDEQCLSCGRKNPGLWGFGKLVREFGREFGFTQFIVSGCIVLFIASLAIDPGGIEMGGIMSMLSPSSQSLLLLGMSGSFPVFLFGHWWTLLSAGWLHGGLLHIAFNMMWVRQLGPATEELFGPARMFIIYTLSSIAGFLLTSASAHYLGRVPLLGGAPYTIGASAAVFGLFGALIYYGQRSGRRAIHQQMVQYAVILGVFGLVFPGVDNMAHLGGLIGGYLAARVFDPLKPETGNHMLWALICVGVTVGSVVLSIIVGLMRATGA